MDTHQEVSASTLSVKSSSVAGSKHSRLSDPPYLKLSLLPLLPLATETSEEGKRRGRSTKRLKICLQALGAPPPSLLK